MIYILSIEKNNTYRQHYALGDIMLSTTSILNNTGAILQRYNYTAFGSATAENLSITLNFPQLIHGEYCDNDTGLSNYGFRYYSPILGRWLSRDPLEEQGGLNLYTFVGNSSLNYFDLFGEQSVFFESNLWTTPAGFSLFIRLAITITKCPLEIEGSLFIAAEWQPPALEIIKKIFHLFNIHIEFGVRLGAQPKLEYSECTGGLGKTSLCGRFEVFARVDYRRQKVRGGDGKFTRSRFGAGADGGGEVCYDFCNGDITLGASFSWDIYANFGYEFFNRTYNWGGSCSGSWKVGNWQTFAFLEGHCDKTSEDSNCCCIKKYGK